MNPPLSPAPAIVLFVIVTLALVSGAIVAVGKVVEWTATAGTVVLYRDGQAKKSDVRRIGSRCWVSWHAGIEKVLLRGDGTARDATIDYRWTLDRPGPDDPVGDRRWFSLNCTEPPQ